MQFELTNTLTRTQKEQIAKLWNLEYPIELKFENIEVFESFFASHQDVQHYTFFEENREIAGWMAVFTRDDERWFSIIINPEQQGKNLGKKLLEKAMENESVLNGWVVDHNHHKKVNGEFYLSPLGFYKKVGFEVFKDIRYNKKNLSAIKVKWKREENYVLNSKIH